MSGGEAVVLVEKSGAVASVTLNRPAVFNAFNAQLRAELTRTVEALNADDGVRIVILKGAGPGFCAGADLTEGMSGSVTEQLEQEYKPFLMGIALSDKLWIACIHGSAAGIGGALAMACDLAVMDEAANIYLAFAALGLIPDGGATWHLLRAMGHKRALQTIIEGRKMPALECEALGLVNKVAPAGTAHDVAMQWAQELAKGAPLAQSAAKRVLRHGGRMRLQDAITLEAKLQQSLVESEDFRDAVAAFFDKRKPHFKGR
jgi:2-(1,2-epoxy-1,2-dihydrophenyl)acetyl-CoA isomerase